MPDTTSPPLDSVLESEGATAPATGVDAYLMILGVVVLVLIIGVTYFERGHAEKHNALVSTADRNAVLATALAQYTIRALKTAEAVTSYIQREYVRGARSEVLQDILDDRLRSNDVFTGLGVFDASGQMLVSAGGPWPLPPSLLSGSPARAGDKDGVAALAPSYVGVGRTSSTAPFVRRVVGPDNTTAAYVVALVDNNRFLTVFEDTRLGDDTVILLAGADGGVRAAWDGRLGERHEDYGAVRNLAALQNIERGATSEAIDGLPRVIGVRRLPEYPLVALVGTTESGALAAHGRRQQIYLVASAVVCASALMLTLLVIRINRRRDAMAAALERARARLRWANSHLEARVHERTAQLENANRDLELFSYSIAHDVRAPLSTIDGFAALLQPAVAATGDEKMARYLSRIRESTRQISVLTESLLALARLSRHAVSKQEVDLTAMAQAVVSNLREREPNRRARFLIAPGMVAFADSVLLRQMMENLLGNAWKFTGKREQADIEVGQIEHHPPTFFVRDNGAGFDMAYAGKLFQPFQRLHSQAEFNGSGVGLAAVHRIVALHGGRIWAEGEEGGGAAFFFTLPPEPMDSAEEWG